MHQFSLFQQLIAIDAEKFRSVGNVDIEFDGITILSGMNDVDFWDQFFTKNPDLQLNSANFAPKRIYII